MAAARQPLGLQQSRPPVDERLWAHESRAKRTQRRPRKILRFALHKELARAESLPGRVVTAGESADKGQSCRRPKSRARWLATPALPDVPRMQRLAFRGKAARQPSQASQAAIAELSHERRGQM